MDSIGKDCTLLYKEDLDSWLIKQGKEAKYFQKKQLNLLSFERSNLNTFDCEIDTVINYCPGLVNFKVRYENLELFEFTESDGSVTMFKLLLDESRQGSIPGFIHSARKAVKKMVKTSLLLLQGTNYKPLFMCCLVAGSFSGSSFLGYSSQGHLFLLDWETKSGNLIGKWPFPELLYYMTAPKISGAISSDDGSLVAVIGDDDGDSDDDDDGVGDDSNVDGGDNVAHGIPVARRGSWGPRGMCCVESKMADSLLFL